MQNLKSLLALAALGLAFASGCTVKTTTSSDEPVAGDDDDDDAKSGTTETSKAPAPSAYDALYEVKTSASADATKLEGLWQTSEEGNDIATSKVDVRMDVRDGTIKFASRCSATDYPTITVGVTVKAEITDEKITLSDAGGRDQKSGEGPAGKPSLRCSASLTGPGSAPYAIEGSKLVMFGYTFTKVAD